MKRISLPREVRINARTTYTVIFDDSLEASHYGECDFENKEIRLNPKKNKTNTALLKTFIHELLHAIDVETEDKTNKWERGRHDLKHRDIYALEKAIYRLLRLNKWLK